MASTQQETTQESREQAGGAEVAPECLVCPLCMGMAALRQARPEAMEHLLKAGVELVAAARSLLEAAGDGRPRRPGGLQRIDIG